MSFLAMPKPIASSPLSFYPFPRLPLELRTQIWHHAAQLPLVLDLWRLPIGTVSFHATYPNQPPAYVETYRFATTRRVPPLLHVNQESRATALQSYLLAFGCKNEVDEDQGIVMNVPPRIYVNWKADTILFLGVRDDNAIPDALTDAVPAEGASIAIELSRLVFGEEYNEFTAIAGNGGIREVMLFGGGLPERGGFAIERFGQAEVIDFEELEGDEEDDGPELLLWNGKEALETEFQQLEANINGAYRFNSLDSEEAEERLKALERRPVVRFGELLIDGESCVVSGAWVGESIF